MTYVYRILRRHLLLKPFWWSSRAQQSTLHMTMMPLFDISDMQFAFSSREREAQKDLATQQFFQQQHLGNYRPTRVLSDMTFHEHMENLMRRRPA